MASPMDRRIAANIPDSEVPRESYNHPNTYRQLSQNYGQDDVLPAIEDPLRNLIGSPNKGQQEHRSHRMVQHVGQYAAKQIGVPSSGKHENRASISALQEAPSPPSRLRTSPNFATLDYGEQQRKRQRSQYEPIAISHRYDAARSGRSPPTSHSRGSDMPKPPRPYTEQSVQWQTPTQIDPQPYQLIRGGEPEYHLRELREPPGPSKYSSNIHNEIHDRRLFRPLQGGICPTQLQLPQYEKSAPQPPPRSPSAPCSSGVYRPALIGDDKCVAAWGGHPRHLRLGNDSVYKPQDSSLEGTSFHPYFELRGASSHESRHFVPRHYLNSVGDDDEFHSQSLNFQPESNRPSSRELLRLQPDADTDSWKNGPTLVLPSPRLGKPPANENLWDDIRVGQEIRQKKEVKYSHNGSIFGQANVLVPRRSSQAYVLAKKPSEMAGGIRGADREWASKSDRYYRESAIYVKQPAGNFHAVERNSRSQQDIQGPASDKEIIVID
ncbi:MAG: hypothetical protein M1840_006168 [Geoglossum simile]|nr:MAG: hypothetical protein M1840_006168 [Geoglossum simile]